MIKEQCHFRVHRESIACDFLSGICLGSEQGPSGPQGGPGSQSRSTVTPLEDPSPTEEDEPPDRLLNCPSEKQPQLSHWLLASDDGNILRESAEASSLLLSASLNDSSSSGNCLAGLKPLVIETYASSSCTTSASYTLPSADCNQDQSPNNLCAVSESTLVGQFSRLNSQKSTSESTDGSNSVSSSGTATGSGGASRGGLFSPLSLAKTWGQHHSKILKSAMKKRTISLDSSGGVANSTAPVVLNGSLLTEDASGMSGNDSWETQTPHRFVQLSSGNGVRAPFSMFSAIKYSRANNKACHAPATRPRGVKVLPVPNSNDRFLVHQLEEVVLLEFEEKDPCVSYSQFINDSCSGPNPYCYIFDVLSNFTSRKNPPIKTATFQKGDENLTETFLQFGSQFENYLVPVLPKSKSGRSAFTGAASQQTNVPGMESRKLSSKSVSCSSNHTGLEVGFQRQLSNPTCLVPAEFIPDQVKFLSTTYTPNALDDPTLKQASKTCLKLPGYRFSLLPHEELPTSKQHVNERFKDRFPYIQLSLTKLRSMKHRLSQFLYEDCQLDLCIACYALVYFEKLVFSERICKSNRRYSAAVCAILAAKMNDIKGSQLSKLVSALCSLYKINKSDLLSFEFAVLVALKFNLHLSENILYPTYRSLSQMLD